MAKIIRKTVGVVCTILGLLSLLIIIAIPYAFADETGRVRWEDMNGTAVAILILLWLALVAAAVILFGWERYQEWRRERALEWEHSIAAEQYAGKQARRHEKERRQLADVPGIPGTQRVVLYQNRNAGAANYIRFVLFVSAALGSILAIPVYVIKLERQQMGLAAVLLTISFWIGFIGAIYILAECQQARTHAFALTNERILYQVSFAPLHREQRAVTKIGSLIEDWKYLSKSAQQREKQEQLISSDKMREMIEQTINGEGEPRWGSRLVRLNSPEIRHKGLFGASIRYWDEENGRWKKIPLTSSNAGYREICDAVSRRMKRYSYGGMN